MLNKTIAVSNYAFKPGDRLLLDTNIWLFIYGPSKPNDSRVNVYSQAFKSMISAKSQIYIDVLVVSEFINRYARMRVGFKTKNNASKNFKKFRQSKDFEPIARDVADVTKRVLKHCKRIESGFETLKISTLINDYAQGKSDFNDQIITTICRKKRLKLVTDDSDFGGREIPVLTANKKLLDQM